MDRAIRGLICLNCLSTSPAQPSQSDLTVRVGDVVRTELETVRRQYYCCFPSHSGQDLDLDLDNTPGVLLIKHQG